MSKRLSIIENDSWLEPVEGELNYRHKLFTDALKTIENASGSIVDFANGYRYFGFQRDERNKGWWFREWLPAAESVFLFGDFNGWDRTSLPLFKNSQTESPNSNPNTAKNYRREKRFFTPVFVYLK